MDNFNTMHTTLPHSSSYSLVALAVSTHSTVNCNNSFIPPVPCTMMLVEQDVLETRLP